MARSRLRLTARSELRKGFSMPTHTKIVTALRNKSKAFVIKLFLSAFSLLSKTQKIGMLIKIERGLGKRIKRRIKRRSRTRRRRTRTRRTRTRRRTKTRRKSRKTRTAKQRAATRKLVAFNKRRRR